MRRRRGGDDDRLLSYKNGRSWRSLLPDLVNDYVRAIDRPGVDGQGLPHLARHRAGGGRAGRDARAGGDQGLAEAGGRRGDEGGGVVPRATPRRWRARRTSTRGSSTPTSAGKTIERATRRRYDTTDERQAALERATLKLLQGVRAIEDHRRRGRHHPAGGRRGRQRRQQRHARRGWRRRRDPPGRRPGDPRGLRRAVPATGSRPATPAGPRRRPARALGDPRGRAEPARRPDRPVAAHLVLRPGPRGRRRARRSDRGVPAGQRRCLRLAEGRRDRGAAGGVPRRRHRGRGGAAGRLRPRDVRADPGPAGRARAAR